MQTAACLLLGLALGAGDRAPSAYAHAMASDPVVDGREMDVSSPVTRPEDPPRPSPGSGADGRDVVVLAALEGHWLVLPAGPRDGEERKRQGMVDGGDFPTLARTGLHAPEALARTTTITGRSLDEITRLALPRALSWNGFLAEGEDVLSALQADNRVVAAMGLTHPQMARPLFHVLNLIQGEVRSKRWDWARHRWKGARFLLYNGRRVLVEAHDTKGGQQSIFDDDLQGAFFIKIRREPTIAEMDWLQRHYGQRAEEEWEALLARLTRMETGELEPHYIMRYGFYEGHTSWRTDPIAIAFVFGLRSLEEIEAAFPGRLYEELTAPFKR